MSEAPEVRTRTEVRDGMRLSWHVPIEMDDGILRRADVCRPTADDRVPVILSHGIYAKGLATPRSSRARPTGTRPGR
jgi:hypothetical protein